MADTIRQQLLDKIKSRLQEIKTTGEYATNLGNNVFVCRTAELQDHEMPACIIWDGEEKKKEHTANIHMHDLTIELELYCKESATITDVPDYVRLMLADVEKAMGVDRLWDGLAYHTAPQDDVVFYDLRDAVIGVGINRFLVKYRTKSYNPYEQ